MCWLIYATSESDDPELCGVTLTNVLRDNITRDLEASVCRADAVWESASLLVGCGCASAASPRQLYMSVLWYKHQHVYKTRCLFRLIVFQNHIHYFAQVNGLNILYSFLDFPITKLVAMKLIVFFGVVTSLLPSVLAVCCREKCNSRCSDGTGATPCCAHGGCNIFCCNCDGGCRTGNFNCRRESVFEQAVNTDSVSVAFVEADKDGAGNLSMANYLEYMGVDEGNQMWVEWFKS